MFRLLIFSYNYSGADSLIDAFADYMEGYRFYLESDPEEILKKQRIKDEIWTNLSHFRYINPFFMNPIYKTEPLFKEKKATFTERLMIRATFGGVLVPGFFFKKAVGFLRAGFAYNPSQTFLRRNILAVNHITNEAALRSFSRKKAAALYWRYFLLILRYRNRHEKLKKEWQENMSKVVNMESWAAILGLGSEISRLR